jgi:hypothetical protein
VKGRRALALVIRVPLEGEASIVLEARTREDELRLRAWLRRTRRIEHLQHALEGLLDELDEYERGKAAA